MARISIDGGGSYWSAAGNKLFKSGLYEVDDDAVIDEFLNSDLDWVSVDLTLEDVQRRLTGEVPAHEGSAPPAPGPRPEGGKVTAEPIRLTPPSDPTAEQPLTSPEVNQSEFTCEVCGKSFPTKAGFMSHVRNKHPNLEDEREATIPQPAATPADAPGIKTEAGERPVVTEPTIADHAAAAGVINPGG